MAKKEKEKHKSEDVGFDLIIGIIGILVFLPFIMGVLIA
ncbi:hypothetical protein Barb6_01831 [Bacteroidales bacterium Barb6]|nr:hypothetical protein Barb6_01831 [Bacteroidales bacterium Barb6]OAV70553.1 hypothetical protein Barb4_01278 [Bacteroidales bacterium Barb4]